MFDDGSRVMTEPTSSELPDETKTSPRGLIPLEEYYEVIRLVKEAHEILRKKDSAGGSSLQLHRVALQFPDELLDDAPDVCWAFEESLTRIMMEENNNTDAKASDINTPLVFVLGDTTFGPCCPDEVSAMHLQADVLIHYGHACLSPAMSLPVLYGFGLTEMDVTACVDMVVDYARKEGVQKLLLLYEVRYHHAMEELQTQLSERGELLVLMGEIPQQADCEFLVPTENKQGCCESEGKTEIACCRAENKTSEASCKETIGKQSTDSHDKIISKDDDPDTFVVGGLELPRVVDLSPYTLLFVGDASQAPTSSRQYVNTMLRFVSSPSSSPSNFWTYSPTTQTLETTLPPTLQRKLNRRFFLTQKARDASVIGILVGTLSQRHFRSVVSSLRNVIETSGRACYTFAVGKINGAKLANFGEIDCFVLVACNENSLLDGERDLHVPVITPLELDMALGNVEWGSTAYSLDYNDFLEMQKKNGCHDADHTTAGEEEEDEDVPYFSLVTGQYESKNKARAGTDDINLKALPGKGQITKYESAAADFLKKREYKGLEANVGKDEAQAAVPGQIGIASDYGQR